MRNFAVAALLGGLALATAQPGLADTTVRHTTAHRTHVERRADAACERYRRHKANNGTVVGAVAGGVLGNVLFRGSRTAGTLGGAAVGGVAGHSIASHNARKDCYRR